MHSHPPHRLDPLVITFLLTAIIGAIVWFLAAVGVWHLAGH